MVASVHHGVGGRVKNKKCWNEEVLCSSGSPRFDSRVSLELGLGVEKLY